MNDGMMGLVRISGTRFSFPETTMFSFGYSRNHFCSSVKSLMAVLTSVFDFSARSASVVTAVALEL
jgi:hypothetical protein